ncbi:uricase [alpha proteobacterium U9-1i]|nr:uricase [alpha proteobacterium U9-1i]
MTTYPRDLKGYGRNPPDPRWPGGARIAVQIVLNYEEGGENCVLHGDAASETFLSDIVGAQAFPARHMSMESLYEYGSRAGIWRLLRLFKHFNVPVTVFAVAEALKRYPDLAEAFLKHGHEIASHGLKWISYQDVDEAIERAHIGEAVEIIAKLAGEQPLGWYTGRTSPNTRRLIIEHGGFAYDADDYSDDLPFWTRAYGAPHLIVPYTLDANDMRFATPQGFNTSEHFFTYLKDSFDVLYAEGETAPKMMSIGLHCRLAGRPGRFAAIERFLAYAIKHQDVWFARRIDIATHWRKHHAA